MNKTIAVLQEKAKTKIKYVLVKDDKQLSYGLYPKGNKRT